MFRIAICDDNKAFIETEKSYIDAYFDGNQEAFVCLCFESGEELLRLADELIQFDLFLLDYELTGMNGFELANRIYSFYSDAKIAFSTSFYDFTKEGYKYNAVRYLVKKDTSFKEDLCECIDCVMNTNQKKNILELNANNRIRFINASDVIYIESKGHYLYYQVYDSTASRIQEIVCRNKLDDASKELNPDFLRVHQSIVINMKYEMFIDRKNVTLKSPLMNDIVLPISRGRYEELKKSICRYKGSIL